MGFFTRASNGWQIAKTSAKVLNAHKELILFPIMSCIAMVAIIGSFIWALVVPMNLAGELESVDRFAGLLILFVLYIVNYFVVVFFNMGLMHCAKLYFDGEEPTIAKGLQFSFSRIWDIFLWAAFAATVGVILRSIQDNAGWLGKLVIFLVGIVWSFATFFAIPVIAYEKLGPLDAVKRSAELMKQKWGEGLGANFSIGIFIFLAFIVLAIVGMGISQTVNEMAGIAVIVAGAALLLTIGSALHSIFISALYHEVTGNLEDHFDKQMLEGLFVER